jgi:hypothetical protein
MKEVERCFLSKDALKKLAPEPLMCDVKNENENSPYTAIL